MFERKIAMRRITSIARWLAPVALPMLIFVTPTHNAAAQGKGKGRGNSSQMQHSGMQLPGKAMERPRNTGGNNSFSTSLTRVQQEQLFRMREEEKLAHDVYVALGKSSGLQVFNNISKAESMHMRAIERLLSRSTSMPALPSLPPGTFSVPEIQLLYTDLVAAGNASPIAALSIGVKIEEMDIRDLQLLLSQNPPQQVAKVLQNLQRASGNHLRAFMGELNRLGGTYTPEFLDQQAFDNILNSSSVRGSSQFNSGRTETQSHGRKGRKNAR